MVLYIPLSHPHTYTHTARWNRDTGHCGLQPHPPASEGTLCHRSPRGGIPWQAEDKGGSVPEPSGYSVSLCGPACSPHDPSLPPPSAKGGQKLTFGQPTPFPGAEMHQEPSEASGSCAGGPSLTVSEEREQEGSDLQRARVAHQE